MQVTNTSLGGDTGSTTLENAYANSETAGIFHAVSAGNSGNCGGKKTSIHYPASYNSVVAVAATTSSDSRACFSSTGEFVELAAPGQSVYSTLPGSTYGNYSGTSMASPHVAGAAALLIGAGITDSNGDGKVNDEVRGNLASTAVDLGSTGRDNLYGYGRIDVTAALDSLDGSNPPPNGEQATDISVTSVTHNLSGGRNRDKNLNSTIKLINNLGSVVGSVGVSVRLERNGSLYATGFASTDSSGEVKFVLRNAPGGCYSIKVTSLSSTTLIWDNSTPINEICK